MDSYNWASTQIDAMYVFPLLKDLDFVIGKIDEGIFSAKHKAIAIEVPHTALGMITSTTCHATKAKDQ